MMSVTPVAMGSAAGSANNGHFAQSSTGITGGDGPDSSLRKDGSNVWTAKFISLVEKLVKAAILEQAPV